MTPKILVIPSWYPTIDSPATGSFCKEQTELVSDRFDIRIIYPRLKLISKKATLKRLFKPIAPSIDKNLLGEIQGVELKAGISSFLSEKEQVSVLARHCRDYLQTLKKEGWQPDIIHAHGTMNAGLVAASIGRSEGIPYLITEHHSLLVSGFDAVKWALYKQAQEASRLVMVVSHELKKMILMNGVRCDIEVVGNLIDEELFAGHENNGGAEETPIAPFTILFMAVPAFTKDIPTFINALKTVKSAGFTKFQATLIIPDVMADLSRQEVIDLCRENGVWENCRISGSISHDQIPALINSCDVLVSTSITETFGLSVAEAIMSGKPVIATRSGGVEDFITAGNGLLVNIGDYQAISSALIQLMKGEIKRDTNAARADMVARFGKEAFRQRICEIYNKSMNG